MASREEVFEEAAGRRGVTLYRPMLQVQLKLDFSNLHNMKLDFSRAQVQLDLVFSSKSN